MDAGHDNSLLDNYWRPSRGTLENIRVYLIILETRIIGLHFVADHLRLASFNFFWWTPKNYLISVRVAFRPFKVVQGRWFWCQSKCDFLLVHRSNHGAPDRLTPPLFHPNLGVFPLHQIAHVGVSPSRSLKLFGRVIIFDVFQPMWSRYVNVTDRQTDGQTDRRHTVA